MLKVEGAGMRRLVFVATVASVGLLWAADQDATLREAQKQEKAGNCRRQYQWQIQNAIQNTLG